MVGIKNTNGNLNRNVAALQKLFLVLYSVIKKMAVIFYFKTYSYGG